MFVTLQYIRPEITSARLFFEFLYDIFLVHSPFQEDCGQNSTFTFRRKWERVDWENAKEQNWIVLRLANESYCCQKLPFLLLTSEPMWAPRIVGGWQLLLSGIWAVSRWFPLARAFHSVRCIYLFGFGFNEPLSCYIRPWCWSNNAMKGTNFTK